MIDFRSFAATLAVALTMVSAPASAESPASGVDHAALAQPIEGATATNGLGSARTSERSADDDPSQPETATGLDLEGLPRRFSPREAPDWDSTLVR